MARVIPSEFQSILKECLGETADIVRVTSVEPTPLGPTVICDVVRPPDPDVTRLTKAEVEDVAEAASRYVATRWRGSPEPKAVPQHSWDVLMALFPQVYDAPPETGDGWHWMLVMTAEWMTYGGLPEGYNTIQVKEKFGSLRFYHDGSPRTRRIARAVEHISGAICETCGAPGRTRKGPWIRTACDQHAPPKEGMR